MLIRNAQIKFRQNADLRIAHGRITEIGTGLRERDGEEVLDAEGVACLPGLHDHHLHLRSLAAAMASLSCGPPQVQDANALIAELHKAAADPQCKPGEWIRGVGYHESVAGEINRDWLDRHLPDHPVRIQHRSGRLWVLNSRALERVGAGDETGDDPLERINGRPTGRLYDADAWLRERLGNARQGLFRVSRLLASYGVTGVTETTPSNSRDDYAYFHAAQERGELLQNLLLMGDSSLDELERGQISNLSPQASIARGARKFHLHDADLPELGEVCAAIEASHSHRRPVAFHCVTRAELVFALVALRDAGSIVGDRIEHAAITPPDLLEQIAEMGLTIVTQPNFIAERGDVYLSDVADEDQPWLYRLRGFLDAGIPLAGSTDAPFGDPNPWKSMQAAVDRRTQAGQVVAKNESLGPEDALALFLSPLETPGGAARELVAGGPADLCLLDRPWAEARQDLADVQVLLTLRNGHTTWHKGAG